MTTVIGMKCTDGIIIASDSQATAKTKRTKDLQAEKILSINKFSALGGSGDAEHVRRLASAIKKRIGEKTFDDEKMVTVLESILNDLYKKYNVLKSKSMGYNETKILFHPMSVFGTKLKNGSFGLYVLRDDGFVSSIQNYIAIGTGTDLARLVLDMQSRMPASDNRILADLPISMNVFHACVTINEVKNFDSQSGGDTRVAIITKDGFGIVLNDEVRKNYEQYIEQISTGIGKALSEQKGKDMIKKFFKR